MFFRVNIRVHQNGTPRDVTFVMETDHQDLEAVYNDMRRNGLVMGYRYETRRDAARPRAWRVVGGYNIALGKEALCSLQEMNEDLIDSDGTMLIRADHDAPDQVRAAGK